MAKIKRIKDIEARVDTCGSWHIEPIDNAGAPEYDIVEGEGVDRNSMAVGYYSDVSEFIASAPDDIRFLVIEVKRLRKALEEISEWEVGFTHSDDLDYVFESFFSARKIATDALRTTNDQKSEGD